MHGISKKIREEIRLNEIEDERNRVKSRNWIRRWFNDYFKVEHFTEFEKEIDEKVGNRSR